MTLTITEQKCSLFTGINTLEFTAATDGNNINLFKSRVAIDTSNYIVNINGTDTNQSINSLTFAANDKIIIKKKDGVKYFPLFYCFNKNCIKSIDAPLPLMSLDFVNNATKFNFIFYNCTNLIAIPADIFKYNKSVTSFQGCFRNCTNLTFIPVDLFRYNTSVISFNNCFYNCYNLTSIPTDLFRYNTAVTDFTQCFGGSGLTSIPKDLFRYNTAVTSFQACFYGCTNVTSTLPKLWVSYSSASHFSCFYGCTKASNYADALDTDWV